jgi:hypothetical protein
VAVCAIALGAVWMVLNSAPIEKPKTEAQVKRSLAYEQAISQPREDDTDEKIADEKDAGNKDIPDFETVTEEAAPQSAGDPPAIQDIPSDGDAGAAQDLASLPDESADAQDPAAVPPLPGAPGADQWATDGAEQWGDERQPADPYAGQGDPYAPPGDQYARQDDPYGPPQGDPYREDDPYDPSVARQYGQPQADPYAQDPYAQPQGDPYAQDPYAQDPYGAPSQQPWNGQGQAQGPDQNGEQWVQVIGSGTGMRATASEEAPILFAFPYGRQLKVVSRNAEWVEVMDPKSSTAGWMQAYTLGPSRPPGQAPYGQTEAYYDEQPQERPGLFRRGGFADMINRALGGGN